MKRKHRGLIFIMGFIFFSTSSVYLLSNYPRFDYLVFVAGAISLFFAELAFKSRMNMERLAGSIILVLLGLFLLYYSALRFIDLIEMNTTNQILGVIYFLGWILMFYSGKVLKLSKIF